MNYNHGEYPFAGSPNTPNGFMLLTTNLTNKSLNSWPHFNIRTRHVLIVLYNEILTNLYIFRYIVTFWSFWRESSKEDGRVFLWWRRVVLREITLDPLSVIFAIWSWHFIHFYTVRNYRDLGFLLIDIKLMANDIMYVFQLRCKLSKYDGYRIVRPKGPRKQKMALVGL